MIILKYKNVEYVAEICAGSAQQVTRVLNVTLTACAKTVLIATMIVQDLDNNRVLNIHSQFFIKNTILIFGIKQVPFY